MLNTRQMGRRKLGRERINITLPHGMAEELSQAAAEKGWDRSQLIEELARRYLEKEREKKGRGKK